MTSLLKKMAVPVGAFALGILDNADRKGLHDVYAGLMKLRNAHPELFDANANFDMEGGNF